MNSAATKISSVTKQVLKLLIMVGILYYLYSKGLLDFTKVGRVLRRPEVLTLGLFTVFFSAILSVYRWRLLLSGQGIHVSFSQAFNLTFIGMFFNTALPGAVSGDVVKGYYIVRQQPEGKGKSKAFATLLFDRLMGVSGLVFVAFTAMLINLSSMTDNPTLKTLAGFVTLTFVAVIFFYAFVLIENRFAKFIQKILHKLPMGHIFGKVFEAVKCYEDNPLIILKGLLTSILIHSTIVIFITILAKSLGGFEDVPLSSFFLLCPIGLLVTAVPVAPAGLGTGHAAFFALFQLVGVKGGADLFTVFVAFQITINLLGGIFYVRYSKSPWMQQLPSEAEALSN
jgi:uncharacterized protein (TIRG00374 family)